MPVHLLEEYSNPIPLIHVVVLRFYSCQPNGVMLSVVSLPNHMFTG